MLTSRLAYEKKTSSLQHSTGQSESRPNHFHFHLLSNCTGNKLINVFMKAKNNIKASKTSHTCCTTFTYQNSKVLKQNCHIQLCLLSSSTGISCVLPYNRSTCTGPQCRQEQGSHRYDCCV